MRTIKIIFVSLLLSTFVSLESCGPVIISSRPSHPTPHWFYPNRVENVRYIYFPNHTIYYDLSLRTYLYLDNGVWISASILPSRFNTINLRRARQVRINNYYGDNIREYHLKNRVGTRSRRTTTPRRR
jgi:hypothetical protein